MIHLTFGKHKCKAIKNMKSIEETSYLHWLIKSKIKLNYVLKSEIKNHLKI